jgi:hypothetical protein
MKSILKCVGTVFAVTIISAAAFAWPTVGDQVNYDFTVESNGQSLAGQMSVAVESVNPASDSVGIVTNFTIAGQNQRQASNARLSEMTNLATSVPFVLANCQASGGQPEAVSTPAGVFQACKVAMNDGSRTGFTWVANVKFGFVKIDQIDSANGVRTIALFRSQN